MKQSIFLLIVAAVLGAPGCASPRAALSPPPNPADYGLSRADSVAVILDMIDRPREAMLGLNEKNAKTSISILAAGGIVAGLLAIVGTESSDPTEAKRLHQAAWGTLAVASLAALATVD